MTPAPLRLKPSITAGENAPAVEHDGDPMLARIGMMTTLGAGKTMQPAPRRKATKRYRVL
jgi:hypothetical protein